MKETQKESLITSLESLYGKYKYESALFGSANFSKISSDLCYSNSHFTKLISGSATEAMYERALRNIEGLQKLKTLEEELLENKKVENVKVIPKTFWAILGASLLALIASFYMMNSSSSNMAHIESKDDNTHPLDVYFKTNESKYYKSPYLSEEQVHEYCPGSAYEGKWELNENYIIPIPYKVPGLYYVGKSADIRLKCRRSNLQENRGKELIGFENIHNEIWFDTSMTPVDSKYFDREKGEFTSEFKNIDFLKEEKFIRVANVYSCFYDEILITNDSIYRKGEPCGRYADTENEDLHEKYNLNLSHIIEYIIGNMNFAACKPLPNKYCNPNDLINNTSTLSFPCSCSIKTENLGLGGSYPYNKSIKLVEQNYQSNLLCSCDN